MTTGPGLPYIGVVSTLWTNVSKVSPYLTGCVYSGDTSWIVCFDHFEVAAQVNAWDNAAKL